jgi:hypothetical protein
VTRASDFPVSSEGPPHSIASYDTHGDAENFTGMVPVRMGPQHPFVCRKRQLNEDLSPERFRVRIGPQHFLAVRKRRSFG